ncbi:hypothetical protein WAF17_13965 [Bernardetia sp. ABR2-2B]|uniref:hypothetical protein n=1 Tax=Bernardetia sp. ABR2-2B TaxID=3127472 RepID=UPI0030CB93CC
MKYLFVIPSILLLIGVFNSCTEKKEEETRQEKQTQYRVNRGQVEPQRATSTKKTSKTPSLKGTLYLKEHIFESKEKIKLTFVINQRLNRHPWIGIVPSKIPHGDEATNDQHDISYKYFDNQENGVLEFEAPKEIGKYDFRMHSSDKNGIEITYVSFEVVEKNTFIDLDGELSLEKTSFAPNERIMLSFKVNKKLNQYPWIGIIPSEIPHGDEARNDKYDISYDYFTNKESGVLKFKAPKKAGKYDFRMHSSDKNGVEITSISFEVIE